MSSQRKALIVANDEYEHEGLEHLRAPAADAEALLRALGDPEIGDFDVHVVRNEPSYVIEERIEDIMSEGRPDDVLLLHFSCHGLKSESGELFFAARNTRPNRLGSTAISADFVQRCMQTSRSRRIVLFLDCCFGGAFSKGVKVRGPGDVNVLDSFSGRRLSGGRGRAVITASSAMEYSFEGDRLTDNHSSKPSVFTSALVEGLTTGEADRDQDGLVSLNELYDYVFERVREQNPNQTPSRDIETQGDFYIARRGRPVTRPAALPPVLQDAIDSPLAEVRVGAVQELSRLLEGRHAGLALAARMALERLAHDDSHRVQNTVAAVLNAHSPTTAMRPGELTERPPLEHGSAAEWVGAERAHAAADFAERERVERERAAADRAEQERIERERVAEQTRAQQARLAARRAERAQANKARAESLARSRRVIALRFRTVATIIWALIPLLTFGLLAPVILFQIARRLHRHWLWVAFALSIPMVVAGFALAGSDSESKNTALGALGVVLILTLAAATTAVAFLLRVRVFTRRNPVGAGE